MFFVLFLLLWYVEKYRGSPGPWSSEQPIHTEQVWFQIIPGAKNAHHRRVILCSRESFIARRKKIDGRARARKACRADVSFSTAWVAEYILPYYLKKIMEVKRKGNFFIPSVTPMQGVGGGCVGSQPLGFATRCGAKYARG